MKKIHKPMLGDIVLDTSPVLMKAAKVMKNEARLRHCHRSEETTEI